VAPEINTLSLYQAYELKPFVALKDDLLGHPSPVTLILIVGVFMVQEINPDEMLGLPIDEQMSRMTSFWLNVLVV
jgi:hypothetical protein